MPAKIARLATRPLFWIPEVSVAVRSSRPSCSKAEKREYSWQIGSHPGIPVDRCERPSHGSHEEEYCSGMTDTHRTASQKEAAAC